MAAQICVALTLNCRRSVQQVGKVADLIVLAGGVAVVAAAVLAGAALSSLAVMAVFGIWGGTTVDKNKNYGKEIVEAIKVIAF